MPTLTQILGTVYDSLGVAATQGKLYICLPQDMVSVDGTKVIPKMITVDLSATSGVVDVSVYATVGASPSGLAYRVEFDPDPSDDSKPMKQKDGYWLNHWPVPNTSTVTLGSFAQALRGVPTTDYLPITGTAGSAGALVGYIKVVIGGVARKVPYYAV